MPTYLDNPNFIKDASRIEHEDFQSNIVVDASAIAEYETELNRIKAAAK